MAGEGVILRINATWHDGSVVYDSEAQGDPSTPAEVYFGQDFCRDPQLDERLDVLNAWCTKKGRSPKLAPFTLSIDAIEWLRARDLYPEYFKQDIRYPEITVRDYLRVQCPLCHAAQGERCIAQRSHFVDEDAATGGWYMRHPHTERQLWYMGLDKRGRL